MRSALFFAFFGSALTFWIGDRWLGWEPGWSAAAILVSNLTGFAALWVIQSLEIARTLGRPKPFFLRGPGRTWVVFLVLYYAPLLLVFPELIAQPIQFLRLCVPLALSNGFCIVAYGPLQDRRVRSAYKPANLSS